MVNSPEVLDQLVRDRRQALLRRARRAAPVHPARPSVRITLAGRLRVVADRLDPCLDVA